MLLEALKALFIGIVEGITEWLPISSTGHMILVDEFVKLEVSDQFLALFLVVIQIGAIMAVVLLYFHKLNPFSPTKTPLERKGTWRLWGMVAIGCIPAAIVGLLFDDWVNEHFYNAWTVAAMLILYGIIFIVMEQRNRRKLARLVVAEDDVDFSTQRGFSQQIKRQVPELRGKHARLPEDASQLVGPGDDGDAAEENLFKIRTVDEINIPTALKIGLFQVLAIIPGTSRSGATIIGGMLCGCSRTAAAEFTFFLAIPIMFGWGLVKAVKFLAAGLVMSATEIVVLVVGIVAAFVMSVISIRFLMGYIKKNDFTAFGVYRIIVGIVVLGFFLITGATPGA